MSNYKNLFQCDSCDDIFVNEFLGEVLKIGKRTHEFCKMCTASNMLINVYDQIPFEEIEYTKDITNKAKFTKEQRELLESEMEKFNLKYGEKFSIDYFGFGFAILKDGEITRTSWENYPTIDIRYKFQRGVG